MKSWNRDEIEGKSYRISEGPIDLSFLADLPVAPEPFADGRQIPWNDPGFSRRMLAVHLGGRQITVNAIAPGFFPSKMTRHLLENYRETFEKACPLGRIGEPADMAGIAVFLASRAASYINGAVIPVDGGHSLKTEA